MADFEFIKGMDVSTLIEEEACGAKFYDKGVEGDALEILKKYGTNYVRLRLWNDPYSEDGKPYGAGTNDLEKLIALSKRAKALDMGILLDFHYSDFWADPGKQIVPKAWKDFNEDELEKALFDFTKSTVQAMIDADVPPTMIQIGNEITNGLLWPTGKKPEFDNIARYVSAGIRAVRELMKEVPIMIHLDNGGFNSMYVEWFENYVARGEDFQIIGFSYYPFWHGTLDGLSFNMADMAKRYGKKIIVDEVSMGFTMEDYRRYEVPQDVKDALKEESEKTGDAYTKLEKKWIDNNLMGYATKPELVEKLEYPMTKEGQAEFMQDVMERIKAVDGGSGFFYWEPAWVPVPGCGWATPEALQFTGEVGKGGNEWANQALFDYDGNTLPALETIRDFK